MPPGRTRALLWLLLMPMRRSGIKVATLAGEQIKAICDMAGGEVLSELFRRILTRDPTLTHHDRDPRLIPEPDIPVYHDWVLPFSASL